MVLRSSLNGLKHCLGSFPKGMHSPTTLGFDRSRSAAAIITRWPEAFSRVVPIGDSPIITLGFSGLEGRWPEAFSRVVPIRDSPTIPLGFVAPSKDAFMTRWPRAATSSAPHAAPRAAPPC